MKPVDLAELARVVGASVQPLAPAATVSSVQTDTRALTPGALFVAIRGERFDGHDFLPAAASAGAVAAVVERETSDGAPPPLPLLRVRSTRAALGALAFHARTLFGGTVVAVGGSNGKTTTKRLIDAVLSAGGLRGSASPASFNNDIGVPLSILPADSSDDYLVLELGTNYPGELSPLSRMASPDVAVLTNATAEHLEGLGDLEGVRREEAQLSAGLRAAGSLVVFGDDPALLRAVGDVWQGGRVTFGESAGCDVRVRDVRADGDGVTFAIDGGVYRVHLIGRHNAMNAAAAVAVGRRLGVSDGDIATGLSRASAAEHRMQLRRFGDVTVLDDCYNANPASASAALRTLAELPCVGRRVAVLGDMLEMGPRAAACHADLAADATRYAERLVCVGRLSGRVAEAALASGWSAERVRTYADAASAGSDVASWVSPGDLVLLKGSRGMRLERVGEAIARRG